MQGQLNWFTGGILLAIAFTLAVWVVKPIGVSTQFVIADGIILSLFSDDLIIKDPEAKTGYSSKNAYLNKSGGKYAKNVANPLNYSLIFVFAIILGAFLSKMLKGPRPSNEDKTAPKVFRTIFPDNPTARYVIAFAGGFLVLFGARLAGGCTSGHMMSGMMQTALSGYLFTVAAFAAAIPAAILIYGRKS